ncbi:MAG: ABC transporter substrate-binding protein [Chitinophagaceae bacterium]|nr:ABC transporter substrate-binding protein [Chitinophagaceae bacterium]
MILSNASGLGYVPNRIISLVPSQTELLHYLGLEQQTVGITKFCVHPAQWFQTKTRVGGTKTVNSKIIDQLQPDLIIANKEENVKEQVEELAANYPVWLTDVNNLDEALQMIHDIGELTGKQTLAYSLIRNIRNGFNELAQPQTYPERSRRANLKSQTQSSKLKTAYLIWQKPYMTVGGDTFINDMLLRCGFENIFADRKRYPETSISELQTSNLKLLLLSSEPYPFKQKHMDELAAQLPGCKILLADGEYFSWYGSRLLQSAGYFKKFIENCS